MQRAPRGQSSTEWITILAVVLIISLLAILLTNSSSSNTRNFLNDRAKSYWGTQARPLLITDWDMNVSSANTKDANLSMQIYNPTTERITIESISLKPGYFKNAYYLSDGTSAGSADTLTLVLSPASRLGLILRQYSADASSVEVPTAYELNLTIGYDKGMGSAKQIGTIPIAGKRN